MEKYNQDKPLKIYSQKYMLSKLHIIKVDYHILENSLRSVKFLMHIKERFEKSSFNLNTIPTIFLNKFKKPTHNYPTNFARTDYSKPSFK